MFEKLFGLKNKITVLIIEDDKETAALLTKLLESNGYTPLWVADGIEGMKVIQKRAPNLILLDIMMPRMDGFNILLMLKSQPKTQDIPVLMCSVLNNIKDVEKCCKWGAVGYITKPFDIERVLEKVNQALK